MTPAELEAYLHEHIPLSGPMGVTVLAAGVGNVRLAAPLAPNINHRQTVFGGSLSSLAILAAWSLVHLRLQAAPFPCRIVIRRQTTEYLAPATDDFEAYCAAPDAAGWNRFLAALTRHGKAHIELTAEVTSAGVLVAAFSGQYVALRSDSPRIRHQAQDV
jgi:thioesterase domain-containing protein